MTTLTIKEKDATRDALKAYVERYPSQNKAAASLRGISAGTLSTILNSKYDAISDDMFRNIASQVKNPQSIGWQICETKTFNEIIFAMTDAQQYRNVRWVVGAAGCGKTTAAEFYESQNKDVFVILCSTDMKKGDFIAELASKVGIATNETNMRKVLNMVIDRLVRMDNPLLIFDEGDKLTDDVFYYFISLYNLLKHKAGVVFLSTSYIKRRIEIGLEYNKKGYQEIFSRIGRKFFEVENITAVDVYSICVANGISDEKAVTKLIKAADSCDFDLRFVESEIHKIKRTNAI